MSNGIFNTIISMNTQVQCQRLKQKRGGGDNNPKHSFLGIVVTLALAVAVAWALGLL
jgi:hypothetical protein